MSVILEKSYSTNLAKLRAGWMESRGRKVVGLPAAPGAAGVVVRASRTLEGWLLEVEMAEAGRLEPVEMVLALLLLVEWWREGGGLEERAVASCCSRRALARRRLISWRERVSGEVDEDEVREGIAYELLYLLGRHW